MDITMFVIQCCLLPFTMRGYKIYRLICLSILLSATLVIFGYTHPFSLLFSHLNSEVSTMYNANNLNTIRYRKALDYFENKYVNSTKTASVDLSNELFDIVNVIVTVSRKAASATEQRGYLIQTAATLDAAMKLDNSDLKKLVIVCNADSDPIQHDDAVFLQKYLSFVNRKQSSMIIGGNFSHTFKLLNSKLTDSIRRKEIEDYMFCMHVVNHIKTKYVLMLEDDVIPVNDLYLTIEHVLHRKTAKNDLNNKNDKAQQKMAFIKLYFPQRWQGFAFETVRIAELISCGIVAGIVLNVCCNIVCGNRACFWRINVSQYVILTLFSIIVLIIVGRVNVLEIRRLSRWFYKFGPSPECCTQAMLYPSEILPELIHYFQFNSSMNKDLAIHDFTVKSGHPGYQIEPNLFLHIGMHTSLASSHKDPEEFLFDIPFDIHGIN